MKFITDNLIEWANIVEQEIHNEETDWHWPKSQIHQIFEQSKMKFINRNLNYFNLPNMVAHALVDEPEYHPGFIKTLEFCNYVRSLTNDNSPFGRMCVWYLPSGCKLLPHVDNFPYHTKIIRNIFIISINTNNTLEVTINEKNVPIQKGTLFQFNPDIEIHSFSNSSDHPFYFLGFDFWKNDELSILKDEINLDLVISNPDRYKLFTGDKSVSKYISRH